MSLNLKFRWSDVHGEGFMNKTDAARLREEDWLLAADFLSDVIRDAEALYEEVIAKTGVNPVVMSILNHNPKEAEE